MASAPLRRGPPPFSVTDASHNGVRRLAISGELDMATAPALEARLAARRARRSGMSESDLELVRRLCSAWGSNQQERSKTVWVEYPL